MDLEGGVGKCLGRGGLLIPKVSVSVEYPTSSPHAILIHQALLTLLLLSFVS